MGISGMDGVELFRLVTGFRDGQGLFSLVNGGVGDTKPGESKDDVFLAAAHSVEEMFLGDPFDVGVKGASVVDCTSLVCGLVHISNSNGGGKFFCREMVFPDKLPVDAGDVSTGVYQCRGVSDFDGV